MADNALDIATGGALLVGSVPLRNSEDVFRTVASALPGGQWMHVWIYFVAPILGMLGAAQAYLWWQGREGVGCAKLQHPEDQRCIHCGHEPGAADGSR